MLRTPHNPVGAIEPEDLTDYLDLTPHDLCTLVVHLGDDAMILSDMAAVSVGRESFHNFQQQHSMPCNITSVEFHVLSTKYSPLLISRRRDL